MRAINQIWILGSAFFACSVVLMLIVDSVAAQTPTMDQGQQLEADPTLVLLQSRLEKNPQHADNWRLVGKRLQQLGQIEKAQQSFQQALALEPDSVAAHYDMGMLLKQNGQADSADSHFQQVVLLSPTSSYASNLVEQGLARLLPTSDALEAIGDNHSLEFQPASYQIQTFDGSDDLKERSQLLQAQLTSKPRRLRAFVEAGAMYNTNVSLTPTSRELRSENAASAQAFINPDMEWVLYNGSATRAGPITRGYFSVNEGQLSSFNLASFQGGVFLERDFSASQLMIGRFDYLYVLDLLGGSRFGARHNLTSSLTCLRADGGFVYGYGTVSFANFAKDGSNPSTDSLDGTTYTIGISRVFKPNGKLVPTCSIGSDFETAQTTGLDFRYRSIAVHADSTLALAQRWSFVPELAVGYRNYYAFTGSPNRDEITLRTAARLRYQRTTFFSISTIGSFDRFISKNDAFDAQRVQVGLVSNYLY